MYSSDNAGGLSRNRSAMSLPNSGVGSAALNNNHVPVPLPDYGDNIVPDNGHVPVPLPDYGDNIVPDNGHVPVPLPDYGDNIVPDNGHVPVPLPDYGDNIVPDNGHVPVPLPDYGDNIIPDTGHVPVPLPEYNGPPLGPGITIPVRPQPSIPCYNCSTTRNANVRFLNAAVGYRPFRVYINNRFIINGLGYASLTPYGRVAAGFQTITITGMNGYTYLQKSMPIRNDDKVTMAIINTPSGIDLLQISDLPCSRPVSMSCLRACNLASNTNPLDMILTDGRVVFSDIRFKEVTAYRRARPGEYEFYLAETNLRPMPRFLDIETSNVDTIFELPQALVSFFVDVGRNATYTVYILSGPNNTPASVQTMVVEDR